MNQRRWGVALSYLNIFLTAIIGLIYTPVMLRLLGQSEYGLYSLIGSVVGYLSILDMGLGNTLVRYIAKNRIEGTQEREAELNGLFISLYGFIGVLAVLLGSILYINIDALFADTLSDVEMQRARIMILLLIFNLAMSFPLSVFASIMQAYEKYLFLRTTTIVRVILNPLLVLPFLFWGYGSVMMVVVSTILNLACLFANCFYCCRYLHVKFKRGCFEKKFVQEVAVYSFFIFLNVIMDKIYWGTGQFVLGIVSGTIQVAIYAIAMQFMQMYINLSTAFSSVLLPKVTMMVARGADAFELTALMIRVGRLQYFIVGYFFVMFLVIGDKFIELWAGADYLSAYPIVLILMGVMIIPLVQNVGIAILQAMNLNCYRATAYTICAFVALFFSFPLAETYNGLGCAMATSVSLFVSTGLIINRYYKRKLNLDIKAFWYSLLSMSRGVLLLAIIGGGIRYYLCLDYTWHDLFLFVLINSLIYIIVMYSWCMNHEERGLCRVFVKRLKGFIQ